MNPGPGGRKRRVSEVAADRYIFQPTTSDARAVLEWVRWAGRNFG